jgi:hypothetical protein
MKSLIKHITQPFARIKKKNQKGFETLNID